MARIYVPGETDTPIYDALRAELRSNARAKGFASYVRSRVIAPARAGLMLDELPLRRPRFFSWPWNEIFLVAATLTAGVLLWVTAVTGK